MPEMLRDADVERRAKCKPGMPCKGMKRGTKRKDASSPMCQDMEKFKGVEKLAGSRKTIYDNVVDQLEKLKALDSARCTSFSGHSFAAAYLRCMAGAQTCVDGVLRHLSGFCSSRPIQTKKHTLPVSAMPGGNTSHGAAQLVLQAMTAVCRANAGLVCSSCGMHGLQQQFQFSNAGAAQKLPPCLHGGYKCGGGRSNYTKHPAPNG